MGRPESWMGGIEKEEAERFLAGLGYQPNENGQYNLKMDYKGKHGIVLPADTQ